MSTSSSQHHQARLDQLAMLDRQLKQERLDLIRAMAGRIDSPDIVESHVAALVKLQGRLEALREERARITADQHD